MAIKGRGKMKKKRKNCILKIENEKKGNSQDS